MYQRTVKHVVDCVGQGLHSGEATSLIIYPAPPNTGIKFVRTDVHDRNNEILARYDNVVGTQLGTTISNQQKVDVSTIEHLMAALWGFGIDNAVIEIAGPEIPIMDGSSIQFISMLQCAGTQSQAELRKYIQVVEEIKVSDSDSYSVLRPGNRLDLKVEIDFSQSGIAPQTYSFDESESFEENLASARTFGFKRDAERLKSMGLARGASLESVIVMDGDRVLNDGGLRYSNELVRHKALDLLGDYYLAGSRILASIESYKPGHKINNKVLQQLFATPSAWRMVELA